MQHTTEVRVTHTEENSAPAIEESDIADPFCTKVGGEPTWLVDSPERLPLRCKICGDTLALVVQAYSPLDIIPSHERVLYVFSCTKPTCSARHDGWCVVRAHVPAEYAEDTEHDEESYQSQDNIKANYSDEGDGWGQTDDWGASEDWNEETAELSDANGTDIDKLEDLLALRDKLSLNEVTTKKFTPKHKDKKTQNNYNVTRTKAGHFVPHYLTVEEEPIAVKEQTNTPQRGVDGTNSELEDWSGEEYEYTPDRTLHKFMKKLELSPMQCVRYKFRGSPLLMYDESFMKHYNQTSGFEGIPPCSHCGSQRVFEMQIMPTIIYFLKPNSSNSEAKCSLDFGVVVIFVCEKSCLASNCTDIQFEYAYVQPEKIN